MKKRDLLRSGENIIRVLDVQGDRVLVIDCIKRTMPVWVDAMELESYSECTSGKLSETTGVVVVGVDDLDADQKKTMYERYTMIAPVLSYVADDRMRSRLICSVAEEHGVSKQTVRSYLCLYLAHMDVVALAPNHKKDSRELTQDEKNIRWALNKFFYTTKKQSLITASPEFMNSLPSEEQKAYFQTALDFISERVGKKNILSAVVHMDERTPHMHLCSGNIIIKALCMASASLKS